MTTTEAPATPADVRHRGATTGARHTLGRVLVTLARSIAIFVPVYLIATFMTLALRSLSGLGPARIQPGEEATPETMARVEAQWGLNRPFLLQYVDWPGGVPHGRLGTSWTNGAGISTLIGLGLGMSLAMAFLALITGMITVFAMVISVMPAFVVGSVLVAVFAVGLHVLPSTGYMPAALSSSLIAYRENHATGAVVRGLSPHRIFFGHVLRNGLGPALVVLGLVNQSRPNYTRLLVRSAATLRSTAVGRAERKVVLRALLHV
ncbi:ABC transporter permease [Streptomyces sp. NPDC026672]|uniref:ABC transporter permease n=1 Tax=unclassified Streptomyces TaxID=2593676 RepID=UPI0033D2893C